MYIKKLPLYWFLVCVSFIIKTKRLKSGYNIVRYVFNLISSKNISCSGLYKPELNSGFITLLQYMETLTHSNLNPRNSALLNQIITGLEDFYRDRSKLQVWNKIFYSISLYISKEGPISADAQKIVNFYLQNKCQSSTFGQLIVQHKEIICKIYDFALTRSESVDDAISSGMLSEVVFNKLQKSLSGQSQSSSTAKILFFCVEAVALHFCQFLNRFKQANGSHILFTNRRLPQIFKRKSYMNYSNDQFMKQIFSQPVTLLQSFLDNVKPILANYLNMESLFEITSKKFRQKKAFFTGYTPSKAANKPEIIAKTVNLNTIFDCSYAGREMIEKKLASIDLSSTGQANSSQKWSLLTCIEEFQFNLQCIFEKLPLFLKPLSNGDILSYLRKKFIPIFKYQVMKSGYIEGPFLSEFVEVFVNVGKNPIQIISLCYSTQTASILQKNENGNIWDLIQKLNLKYSKIKIGTKSIGIVPSNCFYLVAADPAQKNPGQLSQLIRWSILPKNILTIANTIQAIETKKKMFKNYFFFPLQLLFLDFLNHEYTKIENLDLLKIIITYVDQKILKEEKMAYEIIKNNPSVRPIQATLAYAQRFCFNCRQPIITYYCKVNRKEAICMNCAISCPQYTKISDICVIYHPNDLRDATIIAKIYVYKRKTPGQKVENKYQTYICNGLFIGSYENDSCRGSHIQQNLNNPSFPINNYQGDELYFLNKFKQMRVISSQDVLMSLALSKVAVNEAEKQALAQKTKTYAKTIVDIEEFKKSICAKYDKNNNVMTIMHILNYKIGI